MFEKNFDNYTEEGEVATWKGMMEYLRDAMNGEHPVFIFVFMHTTHYPYEHPSRYNATFNTADTRKQAYLNSMRWLDDLMNRLFIGFEHALDAVSL